VIVVDDGIATGASMHAALAALRARGPARVIVATPVCAHDARAGFAREADALVSVIEPREFMGIGQFYADFTQTSDDTVRACLDARRDECARGASSSAAAPDDGGPSA
jgi:putative phosphoribosyl transferase